MPYRQNCRPAALLALWLTCVASSQADADDALVDRTWQLDRNSAAWATLTSNPDGLTVDLKAAGKGPLHLTCDKPLPLPDGVQRLTLWADPAGLGNAFPWKVLTASVHARVCDARGAVYRFPFCMGSLNNRGWGCLATEDLARCPYRQTWEKSPQKPLALIGLEIQPGPNALQQIRLHGLAADTDAHTLPVRPWEVVGLTNPEDRASWNTWTGDGVQYDAEDWHNAPYLTADALIDRPGNYRIGFRLRALWEGPVQREWTQDVALPPAGFAREKRRPLPLSPPQPGTYFAEARLWQPDGTLRAVKHFLLIAPTVAPSPARSQTPGGFLMLQADAAQNVTAANEHLRVKLQVTIPPVAGEKSVHILLTDYQFAVLKDETRAVRPGASGSWNTSIEFPPQARGACRAFVQLQAAGKVLDHDSLVLGKQPAGHADAPAPGTAARLPNGVTASAMLVYEVSPSGLDGLARVGRGMDQALLNGNQVVEIQLPWQDLEPLPGLYQFDLLDQILDLAETKGLKVKVAPWFLGDHAPRWLLAHPACYEDGSSTFIGGSHFTPSPADPAVQAAVARLWQAVARHCRHHPALSGYLIVGPSLDLGYWHNGLLHETDYAPSVVASYQHYLQDVRGDALAAVSARYGRSLASWQELMPPQKSWESELDLRPEWVDFCDYQQWQLYQWLECVFRTIRQADPVHDMTQYQFCAYGPQEYYYPLFQKYCVEPTTGGTEGPNYQRFMSVYYLWGLRSRGGETIQTVNRWNFYRSMFNMLAYGGPGGYYAVQWHNVFPEPWDSQPDGPLNFQRWTAARSVGGWLKRVRDINFAPDFARGSRLLAELGRTQPMPAEAGALSSYANCLYKMRCLLPYFVSGSAVNRAWMEREHRLPLWVTESTPPDLYRRLKLLVADADIPAMSRTTAANLASYAKSGGCLVAFAATGRYTVETGRADFGFLSALGFAPPTPRPKNRAGMAAQGPELLAGENLVFNDLWTLQPPPQTEILANLPDGTPCVFRRRLGAGEIILFLGQLDWERSGHVLGALCRHRDVPQWCDATGTRVQVYALHEDDTRYVLAYDLLDHRQNQSPGGLSVNARVKIRQLTAPAYSVTELVGGQSLGVFTPAQLEAGLPLQFQPGQLKVLKCLPANPAGS